MDKLRWLVVLALTSVLWFAAGYYAARPDGQSRVQRYLVLRVDRQTGQWRIVPGTWASERNARRYIDHRAPGENIYYVVRFCSLSGVRGGG